MTRRLQSAVLAVLGFSVSCQGLRQDIASKLSLNRSYVSEQAIQSDLLADSIGIDTHISYTDKNYVREFPKMLALLRASGVRHVRDGFFSSWPENSYPISHYRSMADAGIDLTLISDKDATLPSIKSFAHWVGNLAALEGMNECDANKCIPLAVSQLATLPATE